MPGKSAPAATCTAVRFAAVGFVAEQCVAAMQRARFAIVFAAGLLACPGCESPEASRILSDKPAEFRKAEGGEEDERRQSYQSDRTPEDLDWLLANRIETGMTLQEVTGIVGEQGRREPADRFLSEKNALVIAGDVVYGFGPDREGRRVYLVFREGKLVNFEPSEFKAKNTRKTTEPEDE